jgi:hypothetical protein
VHGRTSKCKHRHKSSQFASFLLFGFLPPYLHLYFSRSRYRLLADCTASAPHHCPSQSLVVCRKRVNDGTDPNQLTNGLGGEQGAPYVDVQEAATYSLDAAARPLPHSVGPARPTTQQNQEYIAVEGGGPPPPPPSTIAPAPPSRVPSAAPQRPRSGDPELDASLISI